MTSHPDLNILTVYYESLIQDTVNELKRIQSFLGVKNTDERLQEVTSRCSIGNLRDDVQSGRTRTMLLDKDKKPFIFRKGSIGDWQNYLTVSQNAMFDRVIKDRVENSMFKFQYLPSAPSHKL
ncbi:cytosolic sulfotransferase 1-like [Mya arenaria]|uniref:cytosolic sulfotransferase 1-like n=1 Tax=Mya arenaria TaxID=6604 RepID=UPI0022E86F3C|nr:cytosolic sulfotransferase 1-like [Mya arenaria]